MATTDTSPPPSRWTLRTIRATFDTFRGMTLGGVWRALAPVPGRAPLGGRATLQP